MRGDLRKKAGHCNAFRAKVGKFENGLKVLCEGSKMNERLERPAASDAKAFANLLSFMKTV